MLTIEALREETLQQLSSLKYQLTPEGEAEYQGRKVPKKEKINAKINTTEPVPTRLKNF